MPQTPIDITRLKEVVLFPWEELVGACTDAFTETESTILIIETKDRTLRVTVPALKDSLLSRLVGKCIGVLRTDDPTKPFVVRYATCRG